MRTYANTCSSPPAFDAEYGLDARSGASSVHAAAPSGMSPYTSSVDTCTKRLPWWRAWSSSTCVPSTSVRMNSAGPRIERSTCVSAAKLTIASTPFAAARDRFRVGDVALVELVLDALEVRAVARVRELVEDDDLVAVRGEPPREVRADEPGAAGDEDFHAGRVSRDRSQALDAAGPSRQCGSSGAPRSLRSTEYAGRGARAPNSAVVIRRTRVSSPASSKIASANSAHVQSPRAATWYVPYGSSSTAFVASARWPTYVGAPALVVDDRHLVALRAEAQHRAHEVVRRRPEEPRAPHDPRLLARRGLAVQLRAAVRRQRRRRVRLDVRRRASGPSKT